MRSHIIADLSVNHVERSILRCGHTAERIVHDYGIDLTLYTYNDHGEPESDAISIQLKATDHLVLSQDQQVAPLSIERSDLERWLLETMPVILILYDAQADVAFWLYLQAYFAQLADFDIKSIGQTFTVHLPKINRVDEDAIRRFRQFKARIQRQIQGVTHDQE